MFVCEACPCGCGPTPKPARGRQPTEVRGVDPSILWLYVLYVSKYIMDKVTTLSRKIYPYLYLHIYRSFIYIFISISTPIP